MGMTALSVFLMVQIEYGSYATAGKVVGVIALAWTLLGPVMGKAVDRHGQFAVLRWGIAVSTVGRVGLVAAAVTHQPTWALMCFAPLFPATGSIATYTRARWSHAVRSDDDLNTAFSLEASLDEILFIVGPAVATLLATQVASWAGVAVSTAALVVGGYGFILHRASEPPATDSRFGRASGRRSLRLRVPRFGAHLLITTPAVLLTAVIFAAQGALFASTDAATVAMADEAGHKGLSGPVLAVFALGSLIGGLIYGARVWRIALASRLTWGVGLTGLGVSTFIFAPNLVVLAVAMFITGAVVAPTMAVGDGMVQALVPRMRLTEGMAWTRTGIDLGIAVGAALSGYLIERHGSGAGFAVTAAAGLVSAAIALGSWPYLRTRRHFEERVGHDAP